MTDRHTQSPMTGLGALLVNPKYSDLALKCEGQIFNVHRCIVCSKSPVFAAACDGGFQETSSRVVDVTVADVSTLARLLTYLYTGDYNDGKDLTLAGYRAETEPAVDPPTDGDRMQVTESGNNGKTDHAQEEPRAPLDKTAINQALIASAQVYIAADYYQISDLMRLAVDKFRKSSKEFCQPEFADVVAFVYQSTPTQASEMRNILGATFLKNAKSLISDETFMGTDQLSGFFKNALPEAVAHYERRIEMKEARVTDLSRQLTSVTAEIEILRVSLAEAEAKLAASNAEKVRQMVNKAKSCRHCGLKNMVYFEKDDTLRCICRTRY